MEDVIDHRLLTGPALREVRNRLTPSFRLHCPLWYRRGVQPITLDDEGRRVPIDRIVARRVLHGPALREVRNRLTPSFRLHCPIYERIGIQIVTVDDDGRRVEHLYAVRDHPAFLRATGAEDHSVEVQRERGVPV